MQATTQVVTFKVLSASATLPTPFLSGDNLRLNSATGAGPRLTGINLDIFDASSALVTSDAFSGTLAGFALSTFNSPIAPGNYRLVASGTGVRDSSLDVTLSFVAIVPEPGTAALMLAGLAAVGQQARRRQA